MSRLDTFQVLGLNSCEQLTSEDVDGDRICISVQERLLRVGERGVGFDAAVDAVQDVETEDRDVGGEFGGGSAGVGADVVPVSGAGCEVPVDVAESVGADGEESGILGCFPGGEGPAGGEHDW